MIALPLVLTISINEIKKFSIFASTNRTEQKIDSTYNRSQKRDSTYNRSLNNDSTYNIKQIFQEKYSSISIVLGKMQVITSNY